MKKAIPAAEEFGRWYGNEVRGLRIRTLAGDPGIRPMLGIRRQVGGTSCTTSATHARRGAERGGAARDLLGEILGNSRT